MKQEPQSEMKPLKTTAPRGQGSVLGVISLVISILAFGVSGLTLRLQVVSGQYGKPDITVGIAGNELRRDQATSVVYGFPGKSSGAGKDLMLARLPLTVTNSGDKTAQEVSVSIVYPKPIGLEEGVLDYRQQGSNQQRIVMSRSSTGNYSRSEFYVPSLHPGHTINLEEGLLTEPTTVNTRVSVPVRGSAQTNLDVEVGFSYQMCVNVVAKDQDPLSYAIDLRVIRSENIDDLMTKHLSTYRPGRLDGKASLWSRIRGRQEHRTPEHLLIYPTVKATRVFDGVFREVAGMELRPLY